MKQYMYSSIDFIWIEDGQLYVTPTPHVKKRISLINVDDIDIETIDLNDLVDTKIKASENTGLIADLNIVKYFILEAEYRLYSAEDDEAKRYPIIVFRDRYNYEIVSEKRFHKIQDKSKVI